MSKQNISSRSSQRGTSLIEVLVTMLVVSLGLLGAAGTQLAATRYQQTATFRNQAFAEAQFIIEKMKTNSRALIATAPPAPENSYLAPDAYANAATIAANPGCGGSGQAVCTAAQASQRDMSDWRTSLRANLPQGRGAIFPVINGGVTDPAARQVVVMWIEKAENTVDEVNDTELPPDTTCPPPRTAGVRCLTFIATP
jgi:type IV pilus assembly protein PilV